MGFKFPISRLGNWGTKSPCYHVFLAMRKVIGFALRFAWLAICVAALVGALRGYRGKSDWRMEEGLGAEMIVLGFPASLLVAIGFMAVGFVLERFGISLPSSTRAEMITTWLIFVAGGCIQWFVVVPYLVRRWRNVHTGRTTT